MYSVEIFISSSAAGSSGTEGEGTKDAPLVPNPYYNDVLSAPVE